MFNGYKCFNKGLINRYGDKFEIGKLYHNENVIKFGNDGNGFHVCKRLEDTLRYFDAMNDEIDIAKVICHGTYDDYEDDYYGYMLIEKVLTRDEIIDYGLNLYENRAKRFISLFRLTPEEIQLFKEKYYRNIDLLNAIAYYQENDTDVYNNYYRKTKKIWYNLLKEIRNERFNN